MGNGRKENGPAPLLAVVCIDMIEGHSISLDTDLHKRYIDDISDIGKTSEAVSELFMKPDKHQNNTSTKGDSGLLPFISVAVRQIKGNFEVKLYRKLSSKHIIIN